MKQPFVIQEFTKPATPEQNAHIESYHSIAERVICQKYQFDDLKEFQKTMERFKYFYNFKRIHSGVGYKSPYKYLLEKGIDMNDDPSQKSVCVPKAS
jgi:transposase InsO family protein